MFFICSCSCIWSHANQSRGILSSREIPHVSWALASIILVACRDSGALANYETWTRKQQQTQADGWWWRWRRWRPWPWRFFIASCEVSEIYLGWMATLALWTSVLEWVAGCYIATSEFLDSWMAMKALWLRGPCDFCFWMRGWMLHHHVLEWPWGPCGFCFWMRGWMLHHVLEWGHEGLVRGFWLLFFGLLWIFWVEAPFNPAKILKPY